jgi:hypothetical protein
MKQSLYLLAALLATLLGYLPLSAQHRPQDSLYFVRLRDGSTLYSNKVQLKQSLSQGKYLLLDNNRQLPLSQAKEFKGWDGTFAVGNIRGRYDAYKLENEGRRISLFAQCYLSTTTVYTAPTPGGPATDATTITTREKNYFFRKEPDGDIQRLTYHNLQTAMADDPSSIRQLHIARTNLYLGLGLLTTGVALGVAGFIINSHRNAEASNAFSTASQNWYHATSTGAIPFNTPPPSLPPHYGLSPLFFIGALTSLSAIIPIFNVGRHTQKALAIYNGID